jgi:hypothetical protein
VLAPCAGDDGNALTGKCHGGTSLWEWDGMTAR